MNGISIINRSFPRGEGEGAETDKAKYVPSRRNGLCKGKEDTLLCSSPVDSSCTITFGVCLQVSSPIVECSDLRGTPFWVSHLPFIKLYRNGHQVAIHKVVSV